MTSIFSFTSKTDGVDDHLAAHVNALQQAADVLSGAPQATMFNGKLVVTSTTNNINVAIKTLAGANPSASDPVIFRINNTLHMLTSALSVNKVAGTKWFNAGASELATQEIDYFAYIFWDTVPATDVLDIGFARFPTAITTADFSNTPTDEKYLARSGTSGLTVNNECEVIGRFNAILSASASFNWSIPGTQIVINRPIYNTRRLTWAPTLTGYSANPTNTAYQYQINRETLTCWIREGANGTSNGTGLTMTSPFTAVTLTNGAWDGFGYGLDNGAALTTTVRSDIVSAGNVITFFPNGSGSSTWTAANGKRIAAARLEYPIS